MAIDLAQDRIGPTHPREEAAGRRRGALFREARRFVLDFISYGGRRVIGAGVLVALGALAEGVGVLMLVPLLAIITGTGAGSGQVGDLTRAVLELIPFHSRVGQLALPLVAFAVLMAVRSVVILARDVALADLRIGYVEFLRLSLTRRLAATDWGTVSRLSHARVSHLMTVDIQRCATAAYFAIQCGMALVVLVAQVALAFLLSPPLAAFSLTMLALAAISLNPLLRRARSVGETMTQDNLSLTRDVSLFLGGLKQAFSHNREDVFVGQVEDTLTRIRESQIVFIRQQTGGRLILAAISAVIGGVALLIGYGVLGLAPATLMALLFVLARLGGPAGQLQQGAVQLANSLPAYEHIKTLEAELAAAARPTEAGEAAPPRGAAVVFESVSYRHRADMEARGLSDLNIVIQPGSFVGVGGPSGAGKTTFADMLAGLYSPRSGAITVGGRVLGGAVARGWRDQIAYVPQDPYLFNDTVRGNLAWSAPQASESDIWEALAMSGADELVRRLDRGLDTLVGERGSLVSGGERQRLALARAVLRKPDLLILDETTSAIDVQAEADILRRLRTAYPDMTLVIIAHRPEALAACERVLTLAEGRLIADRPGRR